MIDADPITVRQARESDCDSIHAMILSLGRATNDAHRIKSEPADFARHGFGDESLFDALIAERDGKTVGLSLFFYTFSTWLGEPGVYVQDLYVAKSERRTGLGRRLLAETARIGRERGATHLRLTVDAANANAKSFYERLGMEHRDKEDTYHIGGAPFDNLAGDNV